MSTSFTSFLPAPRRIGRSRIARVLVFVLAITLVAANGIAAAMPLGEPTPAAGATVSPHGHCAEPAMASAHAKHASHGEKCACGGKACACMHACDALVLAMPAAVSMPAARAFPLRVSRARPPSATPPLRPPIA